MPETEISKKRAELRKRVARGERWLDKSVPGWEDRVTLNQLDMNNRCLCVLGQVFQADTALLGDKYKADISSEYRGFDFAVDQFSFGNEWAASMGFDANHGTHGLEFPLLQDIWKRTITRRKNKKANSESA